jgi:hypothetical protein
MQACWKLQTQPNARHKQVFPIRWQARISEFNLASPASAAILFDLEQRPHLISETIFGPVNHSQRAHCVWNAVSDLK